MYVNLIILLFILMFPELIFSQGSNYIGPYEMATPIVYTRQKNIVIEGLEFTNTDPLVSDGRCITLWACENVIIRNCKFKDVPWQVAIYAENSTNVTVTNCVFENTFKPLLAGSCKGEIKFEENDVKNLVQALHLLPVITGGSAVQFIECSGPGNSISYNVIENIPGESYPIDVINLFHSDGTPESPIVVRGNWIRGGGPHGSSGGILLGDWGGSYQIAEDNILVDPGQYGMGIAGGHDMTLRNNKIYARQQSFTNVGLSIVNWTVEETGPSYNIVIENNAINWISKDGAIGTAWFHDHMRDACPDWEKASVRDPNIFKTILPDVILNRANIETPNVRIFKDRFNRVSVKSFINPTPTADIDIIDTLGHKIFSEKLSRFRTLLDQVLDSGEYDVIVKFKDPLKIKRETVTIN